MKQFKQIKEAIRAYWARVNEALYRKTVEAIEHPAEQQVKSLRALLHVDRHWLTEPVFAELIHRYLLVLDLKNQPLEDSRSLRDRLALMLPMSSYGQDTSGKPGIPVPPMNWITELQKIPGSLSGFSAHNGRDTMGQAESGLDAATALQLTLYIENQKRQKKKQVDAKRLADEQARKLELAKTLVARQQQQLAEIREKISRAIQRGSDITHYDGVTKANLAILEDEKYQISTVPWELSGRELERTDIYWGPIKDYFTRTPSYHIKP